jgi:hypothetical protein
MEETAPKKLIDKRITSKLLQCFIECISQCQLGK